jgi:transcriptional regulator with XRE-family HTH domain
LNQGGELMNERNNDFDFDFMPIGQAIKKAREAKGMTREQLSGIIDYAPRHIQSIENEGKYPSIELFIQLIQMFDVSVDEYIFPDKEAKKSSVRRRLDAQLDKLDDKELSVIEATVNGLCKAKEPEE